MIQDSMRVPTQEQKKLIDGNLIDKYDIIKADHEEFLADNRLQELIEQNRLSGCAMDFRIRAMTKEQKSILVERLENTVMIDYSDNSSFNDLLSAFREQITDLV